MKQGHKKQANNYYYYYATVPWSIGLSLLYNNIMDNFTIMRWDVVGTNLTNTY